jgi:DNA-directed RNA polymerase specialized sigma24 family protein
MHRTFEELASQEIDRLYQGALFLRAGEEQAAEELLLSTLTASFHVFRTVADDADPAQWLEGRMVQAYLAAIPGPDMKDAFSEAAQTPASFSMRGVDVDPLVLCKAASSVPPRARAALWLVLLRRWSYADASQVLDADPQDLRSLLGYRHSLLTAVMSGTDERDGTNKDLM